MKDATKMLMSEVAAFGGLSVAINTGDIHKCMRSAAAKENLARGQKSGFSPYAVRNEVFVGKQGS